MRIGQVVKLGLLCIFAAGANYLLNNLSVYIIKTPLYIDTVFTAAVGFAAGFIPGIVTALLTSAAESVKEGSFNPFFLCSIAEVCIVCILKPRNAEGSAPGQLQKKEISVAMVVDIFARLIVLYIVCALAVSVLGGVIDFIYYDVLLMPKKYFSAEDTFKIGLLDSGIPSLAINILSRIPVNVVDRFIVILGGYGVAVLYRKTGYNN